MKCLRKIGIAYGVGFFLTFGWLASDPCPVSMGSRESCGGAGDASFIGFYVSLVWPFYWNYKIASQLRKL